MSFRRRLLLLAAIALIAPVIAVLLLLAANGGSGPEQGDAAARQGLRTAFTLYAGRQQEARGEVAIVATDQRLRELLAGGPSIELERRANEIVAANSRLVALSVRDDSGQVIVEAGQRTAV